MQAEMHLLSCEGSPYFCIACDALPFADCAALGHTGPNSLIEPARFPFQGCRRRLHAKAWAARAGQSVSAVPPQPIFKPWLGEAAPGETLT